MAYTYYGDPNYDMNLLKVCHELEVAAGELKLTKPVVLSKTPPPEKVVIYPKKNHFFDLADERFEFLKLSVIRINMRRSR